MLYGKNASHFRRRMKTHDQKEYENGKPKYLHFVTNSILSSLINNGSLWSVELNNLPKIIVFVFLTLKERQNSLQYRTHMSIIFCMPPLDGEISAMSSAKRKEARNLVLIWQPKPLPSNNRICSCSYFSCSGIDASFWPPGLDPQPQASNSTGHCPLRGRCPATINHKHQNGNKTKAGFGYRCPLLLLAVYYYFSFLFLCLSSHFDFHPLFINLRLFLVILVVTTSQGCPLSQSILSKMMINDNGHLKTRF